MHLPLRALLSAAAACTLLPAEGAAGPPTAAQTLAYRPAQRRVDYSTPAPGEIDRCTVRSDGGERKAWLVLDGQGRVLRRFGDNNGDNLVDTWCYYKDGVEVYRDIDSDFDKQPDQCRWFHSAGTRWGWDRDADGKVDSWRSISAHEVAEELVEALRDGDGDAFAALLLSEGELRDLGVGPSLRERLAASLADAPAEFSKLAATQTAVRGDTQFIDFGAGRPGLIPAGARDGANDVMIYEAASALVETGGESRQVQLGTLVRVGRAWRLVGAPQAGAEGVETAGVFSLSSVAAPGGGETSQRSRDLMARLQATDRELSAARGEARVKLLRDRARLLGELAAAAQSVRMREQWYRELADMLGAAVVEGVYPAGGKDLAALRRRLSEIDASDDLVAHVRFQEIWADWGRRSQDPAQDYDRVQQAWLGELREFVSTYPESPDTAEALLQLGMADEFSNKLEGAERWYRRLAEEFAGTPRGKKAVGAVRRLKASGKEIAIQGRAIDGKPVSLGDYRGKVVLVQYWATWCEPCKADMAQLKRLVAKLDRKRFAVLGVNLDSSPDRAAAYLKEHVTPWRHAQEPGGLDGRLAQEMGVMTLPLMLLIDQQGRVVRRSLHVAEVEGELRRLLR